MTPTIRATLSRAGILLLTLGPGAVQAQQTLYDNLTVGAIPAFGDAIGPRYDSGMDRVGQQFLTTSEARLSSVSVHLQRVGMPNGTVAFELWDGEDAPSNLLATIGTFDISSVATTAMHFVTFDNLATQLAADSSYFVVVNAEGTDIESFDDTLRFGLTGRIDAEESEGTFGAARVLDSLEGEPWVTIADALGCHPSGACPNYLRMSVEAVPVPEPSTFALCAVGLVVVALRRRHRR